MSTERRSETLRRILFEDSDHRLYAVFNGVSIPNLGSLLAQHEAPNVCLLHSDCDPKLARTAPYLVELPPQSPFTELLLTQGVGSRWGILAQADDDFRSLHRHFRQLLTARYPDGRLFRFRYYDPLVLQDCLPTCHVEELRILFGPVTTYFAETDTGDALLRFTFTGDALGRRQLTLSRSQTTSQIPPEM